MCGLAGYMGAGKPDPVKLRLLLIDNEERGRHSTGMYGSRLMRKVGPATNFVQDPNFNHVADSNIVLGHTRHATGGAHTKENAHPFQINDDLVGTHNGWLVNGYEIEKKYGVTAEVDSHQLYKVIGKTGDPTSFMIGEGAMALAFKFKGEGYLYRRESRPLFIAKGDGGIYYSSRQEGLRYCGFNKIYVLTPHVLYRINNGLIVERKEMPKPRVEIKESTYMTSWDISVPNSLVEELTGKKYTAPVRTHAAAGAQNTSTSSQSVDPDLAKKIQERLTKYGSKLSDTIKRDMYNMLETNSLSTAIIKPFSNSNQYHNVNINSLYKNECEAVLSKEILSNYILTRRAVSETVFNGKTDSVKEDRASIRINLYGFSDNCGIRALDASNFVAVLYSNSYMYANRSKEVFHNKSIKGNSIYSWFNINKDSSMYITVDLFDSKNKGIAINQLVKVTSGGRNDVNIYIHLDVYEDMISMVCDADTSTKYGVSSNVSTDVTRLYELAKINADNEDKSSSWDKINFLITDNGMYVKDVNMKEGVADKNKKAEVDTCCFHIVKKKDEKKIKEDELYYNDIKKYKESLANIREAIKLLVSSVDESAEMQSIVNLFSDNHMFMNDLRNKLSKISSEILKIKVELSQEEKKCST